MFTNSSKKLVTINIAAEIIGVSPETLRHWDRCGRLKASLCPQNHYRLYDINDLQKFIKNNPLKKPRAKLTA